MDKPDGFIYENVPVTSKQSFAATAEARVRQTVKSAIQNYLAQYLDSKGRYHTQLRQTAPFGVNYITDVSRDPSNEDPFVYNVLLARLWGKLKGNLPAIIISDTGLIPESSGLGNESPGHIIDPWTQTLSTTVLGAMSVEILAAAMSESEASDLGDLLVYILGPLTAINKGYWIHSSRAEDQWEVRLPQVPPGLTGIEKRPMGDDAVDVMWSVTLSLEVSFEGLIQIAIDNELNEAQQATWSHQGGRMFTTDVEASVYEVPEAVRLGVPTPISYQVLPYGARFVSDNPVLAVVDEQNVIRPYQCGTFNVLLLGQSPVDGGDPVLATHPVVINML